MEERKDQFAKYVSCIIGGVVAIALLKILIDKFLGGTVIIILSFLIASVSAKLARRISRLTKLPQGLCAALIVAVVFSVFGAVTVFMLMRLLKEGETLLIWLSENRVGEEGSIPLCGILEKMPFLKNDPEARAYFENIIFSFLGDLSDILRIKIGELLAWILHATPRTVMGMIVFVMSCFYFAVDYYKIIGIINDNISKRYSKNVSNFTKRFSCALSQYLRAYVIIFAITFCQLFIGLMILNTPFAFLIALGVAAVDILPVLGSGAILVPWGITSLCMGNNRLGTGLLILYGIVTLVRQIIEPYIVGEKLGIHPLISLILVFFGFCSFGALGVILCPLLAVIVKEFLIAKNKNM